MLVNVFGAGGITGGADAGGGAASGTGYTRGLPMSFAITRSSVGVMTSAAGPRKDCSAGPYARRHAEGPASVALASKAAVAASRAFSRGAASGAGGDALGAAATSTTAASFGGSRSPHRAQETEAHAAVSRIAAGCPNLTLQA
jgi:hypothetical protein